MSKELQRTLGAAARNARKSLALTQEQTAERLGVSVEFYGRIERGVAWPSIQVFARMAPALGVSADVLLGTDPVRAPETAPPLTRPEDPQELRDLVLLLRKAGPEVVHLATTFVRELERVMAKSARFQGLRAQASREAKAP